jgi:hypothetical protein
LLFTCFSHHQHETMSVIPALGAVILPGDFIIACNGRGLEVCQLKHCISSVIVEVVQWIEAVDAPPLCSRQFDNVVRSKVKELVVGKTEQINAQDVVDVAFVFTPEVLQHFWTDVAGMKQVFFTRVPNHAPFSPIVVDSYPSRIWFSLLIVKDIVEEYCLASGNIRYARDPPVQCFLWRLGSIFVKNSLPSNSRSVRQRSTNIVICH